MSPSRSLFRCQECGYTSQSWLGKCPDCGQFNTLAEERIHQEEKTRWIFSSEFPKPITEIPSLEQNRFPTGITEFDRILGGGVVPGSLILLGGEPGIGKSTLLLQAACNLAKSGHKVLLVSGEESCRQVKLRADRLGAKEENLFLLSEISVVQIESWVGDLKPDFLIVDSIQTLYHPEVTSAPGSVSQVRECTGQLMRLAKSQGFCVFIVGHVTKEGSIAGPRLLEHMVDTVLYFEGSSHNSYRLVRAVKNRYGTTNELAVFEMKEEGLAGVLNPSAIFLSQRPAGISGSVVVATMEGSRPMLVELQALITNTYLSVPRRLTSGVDYNRALLTLAVLERRSGFHLERSDIYINVIGGIKVVEPALDLGLALAVVSAHRDKPLPPDLVVFGEIGLAGEVRYVPREEERVKEALKLGFKRIIFPAPADRKLKPFSGIALCPVKTLQEAIEEVS